jgi:hypothetical protein
MNVHLVNQDNQSTMAHVKKGLEKAYIQVRQKYVKEILGTYELKIEYVTSGSIFAGILTKPIGGEIFHDTERKIIGESPILY